MNANGYFKQSDPRIEELAGYQLPADWWSRPWEYAWAIEYAKSGMTVADMGCGWTYRPFKDALAALGCKVYAVDGDKRVLTLEKRPDLEFMVADITKPIEKISAGSLDRVFCISVLEDLSDMAAALKEFARVIKPDGKIVLTFDVPYLDAPTPVYPGLPLGIFNQAKKEAGLSYDGYLVDTNIMDAVNHQEWNLCVFHCLLIKQVAVNANGVNG